MIEIGLGDGNCRLALLNLRLRLRDLGHRRVNGGVGRLGVGLGQIKLLLAEHAFLGKSGGAGVIRAGLYLPGLGFLQVCPGGGQIRFCILEVGLGLEKIALKDRGLDFGDELALCHLRVEVGVQPVNLP